MKEFFTKLLNQFKEIWAKLNKNQKLILGAAVAAILIALIMLFTFTGKQTRAILYDKLNAKDFGVITKKLQEWGTDFTTEDNSIWVSAKDRAYIRMKLFQENIIPEGLKGWELFDTEKWTTTDFERDINKRRAIIGEITKHIKLLEDIEDVSIQVTMPQPELYIDKDEPYTASVIITPAPYSDITKNKEKIKGIINLVAFGVDKLKKENIVVADNHGNVLSDFSDEEKTDYLKRAREEWKITEMLRERLQNEIKLGLKKFIGEDKVDMKIALELNFDQQNIEKEEFIPTKLKEDNPLTPYDESQVVEKVTRSEKTVNEKFKGQGFVPEGPPGVEPNLPPGYKEATGKHAEYTKDENIKNYEIGQMKTKTQVAPYKLKRISVAVWVDGNWKKVYKDGKLQLNEDGTIKREYIPRTDEEIKKFTDIVRGAIGFDEARGDYVVVKNVAFNWEDKWAKEDLEYLRKQQFKKTLVVALISLFLLFLLTISYRALMRELARRRRIREEELAHQQELMRQAALAAAEKEGVEVQLSLEERARIEMLENAMNIARERPDDVAALLRTWMAEE